MRDKIIGISGFLFQTVVFLSLCITLVALTLFFTLYYFLIVFILMLFSEEIKISLKEFLLPLYDIYESIVEVIYGD